MVTSGTNLRWGAGHSPLAHVTAATCSPGTVAMASSRFADHFTLARAVLRNHPQLPMSSFLCVRSLQCVASAMWTPIGRATSTRLIPVFSARSTRPAPDGFHHQARLHGFASTSLICLHRFHPKLLSQQSQERLCYYRA